MMHKNACNLVNSENISNRRSVMGKATWMAGNYGIMVHFLSHIAPRSGSKKMTVDQMADKFDVKGFVHSVKQMGGKWIIFPFGQNTGY